LKKEKHVVGVFLRSAAFQAVSEGTPWPRSSDNLRRLAAIETTNVFTPRTTNLALLNVAGEAGFGVLLSTDKNIRNQ
jgi:hypothetical protein